EAASLHSCPIAAFCDTEELLHAPADERGEIKIFPRDRWRWMVDRNLRNGLKHTILASKGVHIHGVWETHSMIAAGVARECKRPYVISAHGMLEPWALRQKRIKK